MTVSVHTHPAGYPIYSISAGDSKFELSAFGGQLLSWTKSGTPILFSNEVRAIQDGKTAYRGGAPICFPYFGKGVLLPSAPLAPQHGRARTTVWESEVKESSIVLRTEQPSPDGFGPTLLSCELIYSFDEDVTIEARISNRGEIESPFQLAVHSYWTCGDPSGATVQGLGALFLDNLKGLEQGEDPASFAPHTPVFDRVYPDTVDDLEVLTESFRLSISTQNCSGGVLWNPGENHGLADLGSLDFICVENGVIASPRTLGAGEEFRFRIRYEAHLVGPAIPS